MRGVRYSVRFGRSAVRINHTRLGGNRIVEVRVRAGDVLVGNAASGGWRTAKILAVDSWPDGSRVCHCLWYQPSEEKPTVATVSTLDVMAYHTPIDAAAFDTWTVLCSSPVADNELIGFHEYLKHTDLRRYFDVTGQDIAEVVARARTHFNAGSELDAQERYREAIAEYTRAWDLYPPFYEALDNRGFGYMDLNEFDAALADFEQSLRLNPDGHTALFQRGRCLLLLGRFDEAAETFATGLDRHPDHREAYANAIQVLRDR